MNVSKFVMLLLEALLKLVIDSAKCYEESSNVDADGVPLDDEYFRQATLCTVIREAIKDYKRTLNITDKNEKVNL